MKRRILTAATLALALIAGSINANAAGTAAGTTISMQANFSYMDENGNVFTGQSNLLSVVVATVHGVSLSCDANKSGVGNATTYYACTLTNTGNDSNTFSLAASSNPAWVTALYVDADNDGVHDAGENTTTASTGALAADGTYKFFMAIEIPANSTDGATVDSTLDVTDGGTATAQVVKTTTIDAPSVTINSHNRNVTTGGAFAQAGVTPKPGEVLEYRLTINNGGGLAAQKFATDILLDTNVTFVAGSIWIGNDGVAYNGGANAQKTDAATGDAVCAADICGAASFMDGGGSPYLALWIGNGADENALTGGTIAPGGTIYVYYRAAVK